jgi:hypothetical protein
MRAAQIMCFTVYYSLNGDGQDLIFLICGLWHYSSWIKADNNSDLVAKFYVLLSKPAYFFFKSWLNRL